MNKATIERINKAYLAWKVNALVDRCTRDRARSAYLEELINTFYSEILEELIVINKHLALMCCRNMSGGTYSRKDSIGLIWYRWPAIYAAIKGDEETHNA